MSKHYVTVLKCDRCRTEVYAPRSCDGERELWPDGWCLLTTKIYGSTERHLCPGCTDAFKNWMKSDAI